MIQKLLEGTGLTKSEIIVYSILLKTGSIKIGELTKEITLHRSRIYEAINRLVDRGLVSYVIKNNVKYFTASDPENILNYINEQKEKLKEKGEKIKKLIPELRKQISPLKPHAEAHILLGKEGFKTMRKDVLKQKKDLYMIGAIGKEPEILKYFFPEFERLRIKNKIRWKILFDNELRNKKITQLPLMESKFLPKEYSSPAVINIYADRVVDVLWQVDNPICFMLINKDIAEAYRKWFNLMWKLAKK